MHSSRMRTARFCGSGWGGVDMQVGYVYPTTPDLPLDTLPPPSRDHTPPGYPQEGTWVQKYPTPSKRNMGPVLPYPPL